MTWAARIVPACTELAAALTAAGVPATLSRDSLRVPGAWVRPDTVACYTLAGTGTASVSVLLVAPAAGSNDAEALADLSRLLDKTLAVLTPDEDVDTSVVLPHGTNNLPAFRLVTTIDL